MQDITSEQNRHHPAIKISAANKNHLKDLSLNLDLGKIHLFLGLSGTGKSTLLRQTIFQAAQARFALGLGQYGTDNKCLDTPWELCQITGIPPLIDVTRPDVVSRRSTFGTLTGLHQLLQTLFVNYGNFHCHKCGESLSTSQPFQIRDDLLKLPPQTKVLILAPLREKSPESAKSLVAQAGYVRIKYGTEIFDLQDFKPDEKLNSKKISAVVDRLIIKPGIENRLLESLEAAWKFSAGYCDIQYQSKDIWHDLYYAEQYFCQICQQAYGKINQASLSFFSGLGACPECHGLGEIELPVLIKPTKKTSFRKGDKNYSKQLDCQTCQGLRLGSAMHSLSFHTKTFAQFLEASIFELDSHFLELAKSQTIEQKQDQLLIELTTKISKLLQALISLGIGYLSLKRNSKSLSTGEYQRAILARNSGKNIRETAFLFEEPGSGLHHLDVEKLILHLKNLARDGNTLLISDPTPEFLNLADIVWELGSQPGAKGGEITFCGSKYEYQNSSHSLHDNDVESPINHIPHPENQLNEELCLSNCHLHNLKHIELKIRRNDWTCITGVSGSGKSTLILQCLVPLLRNHLRLTLHQPPSMEQGFLSDHEWVKGIRVVTQSQLKKGDSANILSTLNLWGPLRLLFSKTKYARINGWSSHFFSWKNPDFICTQCKLNSSQSVHENYLLNCSICQGSGIHKSVLRATFKDHNLADILQLTCHEALQLFSNLHRFVSPLQNMNSLGLGYLSLGRALKSLSQGELTRTHLSRELVTGEQELCLILDEPSAGLHRLECQMLARLLKEKQKSGHTIITIDHRQETIRHANVEIQLGPAAGENGGEIIKINKN